MAADPSPSPEVMGIRDLYRRASVAVSRGLRGQVWIRGELSALRERNLHCFVKLAEPARDGTEGDAVLDVVIWRSTWHRIRRELEERSLALREGMTVTLRGELRIRSENGRLQLECTALDTDALLGELAARRLALRRTLGAEGLLDRNRRHVLPPLPLRIGLVASHQSEGYRDFRGVLGASGFNFVLTERPVLVQGIAAPPAIAAAVESLAKAPIDMIVLVRGGGARVDLDAFDHELVVRAIASAAVPVWTGLGHTGDRCLADDVAHASHATPTACAQALVSLVSEFADGVAARAVRLREFARLAGAAASAELEVRMRLLTHGAKSQLDRCAYGLAGRARQVEVSGRGRLATVEAAVAVKARKLPESAGSALDHQARLLNQLATKAASATTYGLLRGQDRLHVTARQARAAALRRSADLSRDIAGHRRILHAFDPSRQLARGWTLTFTSDGGKLVRRAASLTPGQRITSRFADGERTSVVDD